MSIREQVQERYPSLIPLLKQPEIGRLLTQAVQKNWSAGQFQSKFIASRWFRTQSESQRRWWILTATDPGEAKKQRGLLRQEIQAKASQMGISLSARGINRIAEYALKQGLGVDDYWVTAAITNRGKIGGAGQASTAIREIRNIANGEYFRPIERKNAVTWAKRIVSGKKTVEDFQAFLHNQTMKRYPHLKDQLSQGLTLNEIIGAQRELIAEELELRSPADVKMNDPRWRKLLGVRDPKTKKMRMMTDSEVIKLSRSQKEWWQGAKGQEADAAMTTKIAETFGLRKF